MYLEQRYNFFNPAAFNLSTNTILGTTARWSIDRTWPIEEIMIFVNFDVTTGFTLGVPTTNDAWDNILQIVQKINLSINDGRQPRSAVDATGVALLEYVAMTGLNLDGATLNAVAVANNIQAVVQPTSPASVALAVPVGKYQICYRIPCVDARICEPLRTRMYLPVHTHPQDPVLSLTFNTISNMTQASGTGAIGTVRVDIMLIRRVPTAASEKMLRSTAGSNPTGYIDWDILETPFTVPLGVSTEQRFAIPVPGNYGNLVFRQYKGGSQISRYVNIDTDVGDTIANNLGQETRWRLETGGVVVREWRWKHLRTMNDFRRPATPLGPVLAGQGYGTGADTFTPTQLGDIVNKFQSSAATAVTIQTLNQAINFPGYPLVANAGNSLPITAYRAGTLATIDFLTDGMSGEFAANELGGCLDCNTPANNGLKMEVVGTPANVATNASTLSVIGRRFFGDISRWQKF